ncbi:MAG: SGNH/GDSL hydrolase family protein [Rhizobacter sp.]|nr:SGNH/GDSL hydrolase family protein [Ferruginibacter sp.]
MKKTKSWLALGDSYTIGERVPLHESFPYQALQLLRQAGINIHAPEIVAKTGWTSDELNDHINQSKFSATYDIVTLLIGVNNQYRGRNWYEFKIEFMYLLQRAVDFAGGKNEQVFVLSIPDWGVTPFAKERDIERIALEIDKYNEQCKLVADELKCHYIDITTSQRRDGNNPDFLAADGLHPGRKEYSRWAKQLAQAIHTNL